MYDHFIDLTTFEVSFTFMGLIEKILSRSGPGISMWTQSQLQGLSLISQRPGHGTCSYNCNASHYHHKTLSIMYQEDLGGSRRD